MPEELKDGITSATDNVEIWPLEIQLGLIQIPDRVELTAEHVRTAAARLERWQELAKEQPSLSVFEQALVVAPFITHPGQSMLHLWSAIESLFPRVSSEVSFRIALYLAQLVKGRTERGERRAYARRVKDAYRVRSAVAHGSRSVHVEEWMDVWDMANDAYNAILDRGQQPSEDEMEDELLA